MVTRKAGRKEENMLKQGGTVMPKMKTSRAAAKRFKKTGTGLLKRNKAYKSQDATNAQNMKKILPYL